MPVVSMAEWPWRRRLLYQDTTTSSKVMEEGSIILFHRFVSGMLMRVVVGSWSDLMKSRSPEGWQRRALSLMMRENENMKHGKWRGRGVVPFEILGRKSTEAGLPIKISSTVTASILRCKRALPPVSLKKGHRVRKKLETPPNSWRDITADGDNELSNYHWYSTHYAKTYITQHKYPKLNNWVQRCVR